MKSLFHLIGSFLFSVVMGSVFSAATGANVKTAIIGALGISFLMSFMPQAKGQVQDVALMQMWERELVDKFRHEHQWLSRIPSKDSYVNNNIINLTEIGADPEVLIDNTTYPIAVVSRADDNIPISLHKFDTKNTQITDDELYALPYDKEGSVIRDHREALEETTSIYGLHSLAPTSDAANTPVLVTTGPDDGTGRLRLIPEDIIKLKERFTTAGIPNRNRILVLCSEHVSDLLIADKGLRDQYHNHNAGAIAKNYYGFEMYEDIYNPVYDAANSKKAFGAASAVTDRNASTAFYTGRTIKAKGQTSMYMAKAQEDPEYRKTKVGFRMWHLVIPIKAQGLGALVSGRAA